MSEELNGAEFWLPPEFLTEDFFAEEKGGEGVDDGGVDGGVRDPCFLTEFPYEWGYGSDLSASPVEDSVAWTESSDEEDYIPNPFSPFWSALVMIFSQGMSIAGSPQSTLSELRTCNSWSGESSDSPSLVSSPLSSPPLEQHKDEAWNRLGS